MLKIIGIFLFLLFLGYFSGAKDEGCLGCSILLGAIGLLIIILASSPEFVGEIRFREFAKLVI